MTLPTRRVAIALGSNLNDRFALLQSARAAIGSIAAVRVVAESRIDETAPIGPPQPMYLNQMVLVETTVNLPALLEALRVIEARHGRVRSIQNAPRTLDLDIVWAEDVTITTSELLVPHPGLVDRDFWQRELAELLGATPAAAAIAAAHGHAGMSTHRHHVASV